MAKRHFGDVITNYDPENEEARRLFKKAKNFLKDLTKAREVRCVSMLTAPAHSHFICTYPDSLRSLSTSHQATVVAVWRS